MLLKELVKKKRVSFFEKFDSWEEAIRASCKPLIEDHAIDEIYVDSMIDCVKKYGPYIVLAPNIAMPHSQEGGKGVHKTAISFMKVEQPVEFEKGNPEKNAQLFFTIASNNHEEHLENMSKLATMLTNEELVKDLLQARNEKDLIEIDEKFFSEITNK